jgi:membrane protein DedA with SNARE-associated domain
MNSSSTLADNAQRKPAALHCCWLLLLLVVLVLLVLGLVLPVVLVLPTAGMISYSTQLLLLQVIVEVVKYCHSPGDGGDGSTRWYYQ